VSFYRRLEKSNCAVLEWTPMRMLFGQYDIVHLHWPDNVLSARSSLVAFARMVGLFVALAWVRLRGRVVVWTAHNLASHDQRHPRLERSFWWLFGRMLDGVITPMRFIENHVRRDSWFRHVRSTACVPFGSWKEFYRTSVRAVDARARLKLPDDRPVVLCFGYIRRYKGFSDLLDIFASDTLRDVSLLIAGHCPDAEYRAELEQAARTMPNVVLKLEFIPDEDVSLYFGAADLSVFPFKAVTNSGSLRLALTFDKHALVPELPFAAEWQSVVGENWITTYPDGQLTDAQILEALKTASGVAGQHVDWGQYDWDETTPRAVAFFRQLVTVRGDV
jgi:glycosyltransferase involved in cell wall biosynthesis